MDKHITITIDGTSAEIKEKIRDVAVLFGLIPPTAPAGYFGQLEAANTVSLAHFAEPLQNAQPQVLPDQGLMTMQQVQQQFSQQQPAQQQYAPQQQMQQPLPMTAPAQPAAQPAPTTAPTYTLTQLQVAASQISDAGRRQDLVNLLTRYGTTVLMGVPENMYGAFATDLRALGANL